MAYMALPILLDKNSEVLLLTCQTLKKDLESTNQYIVGCALVTIAEISKPDMCRDLLPEVINLINDTNAFIKRKVALALLAISKNCPDLIESFSGKLEPFFNDKDHGVLLCGLELMLYLFTKSPKIIKKYRKYLDNLLALIGNIINTSSSFYNEYEVNGINDPFLQVKIIEIFKLYGQENKTSCEDISDALATVNIIINELI
jgi:AP-1 complex subunit gamma-1